MICRKNKLHETEPLYTYLGYGEDLNNHRKNKLLRALPLYINLGYAKDLDDFKKT